jgi:hypothetical protein
MNYTLHIPLLFRYTLRPAVLLPLLLAGRTLGRPTTMLSMSCLQSHFTSSSVVGGSEGVISYCAEEHGGRGVYLNKSGIEYSHYKLTVNLLYNIARIKLCYSPVSILKIILTVYNFTFFFFFFNLHTFNYMPFSF